MSPLQKGCSHREEAKSAKILNRGNVPKVCAAQPVFRGNLRDGVVITLASVFWQYRALHKLHSRNKHRFSLPLIVTNFRQRLGAGSGREFAGVLYLLRNLEVKSL